MSKIEQGENLLEKISKELNILNLEDTLNNIPRDQAMFYCLSACLNQITNGGVTQLVSNNYETELEFVKNNICNYPVEKFNRLYYVLKKAYNLTTIKSESYRESMCEELDCDFDEFYSAESLEFFAEYFINLIEKN